MAGSTVEVETILAGKYRVERTIGSGGMGVVVEAVDTRLERRVAIKFLLPAYAEHGEASSRFMREARAAVKIKSDHTARVIDVGTLENGSPYMVMEYLEGADLAQVLERDGILSVEDAALYVIQASEAVAEAHSYGIVHRDLKPANLFLAKQPDGSMRIKVLDFGISKVADAQKDHSLTRTSSMMGSPLYMSPEQMRSTRSVDLRTDIWALGVIFYEMVTGQLPFVANSVPELSAKVLLEEHEPLSVRRPDLPASLEHVVSRALCKQPSDRYPSIAEFALDLLPFAPTRARQNVERISRVLEAAGLSTSRYSASAPPGGMQQSEEQAISGKTLMGHDAERISAMPAGARASLTGSAPGSGAVSTPEVLVGATQVNFGQTAPPRRGGRLGLLALLIVGLVVLVGGAALLSTRTDGAVSGPEAAKQPTAEVEPSFSAPEAAQPAESADSEPVEPAASAVPPDASASAAAEASAKSALAAPVRTPKRALKARAVQRPPPQRPTAKTDADGVQPDPFGNFGGRK